MKQQRLIEMPSRRDWKLDRKTIESGRRGVAQAREALRAANERAREGQQAA
ncbi:MAG TPA: hypothetical protein VEA78_00850 [Acidimicrobiales bacterium]|nr:hypothetical protein [Acidimicrobiales bacterium]